MNIVVIGLGSMGKRRIRLIQEIYPDFVLYGIDEKEDRRKETMRILGIKCYSSLDDIKCSIECAFVCTSPRSHASIITDCLMRRWNVFTELNLIDDGYERNMQLAKEQNCHLFLSSTFLYRDEIRYIREKVGTGEKWNYIYHIGQYLPDWHPWENYKDFFAGDKRTNGCREIFAIELPWIISTFGEVLRTNANSYKITDLNITFDDTFMVQMEHKNGTRGVLVVDVVSPCAVRKLEVYAEGKYLSWNGTPDSLCEYNHESKKLIQVKLEAMYEHRDGYASFVIENAYKNEIREFFNAVLHGKTPSYGFEQDQRVIRLIDKIGA